MFISSFVRVTEDAEFCVETFLPEIESATESIELSEAEREELLGAMLGTAVKLLYAFLWQVRLSMSQRGMKTVNDFLLQEQFLVTPLLSSDLGNRLEKLFSFSLIRLFSMEIFSL